MKRALATLASAWLVSCASATPPTVQQQDAPPSVDAPIDTTSIDAEVCATQPCDLQTQCGCPTTQACDLDFSDLMGTACRNQVDTGTEGTSCGGTFGSPQKCARKYICLGDSTNRSCKHYCASNADCMGPRGQCVIQVTANNQPVPNAVTCSSNCDPSAASNPLCPAAWTCDLFTATFMTVAHPIVDCRVAGAAGQGATCSTTVGCAAGLSCITQGAVMKCAKICKPPANTGCPGGTTCMSFGTPFSVGGTEYGACL